MSNGERRDVNLVSLLWAGPEVAGEIASLHSRLFPPGWDEAGVRKMLEHPGSTALIARTGFPKVTVGYAMSQIAADEAEILSIGVTEDWRRVGLGRKLMDASIRALQRAGAKRIFLEVAADNPGGEALYKATGFIEATRRKGYYSRSDGPAVDALVLARILT